MKLLLNGEIVFPSQEAQLIKALRYQSRVQPDTLKYMIKRASDDLTDPQIRVQAFQLLSRTKLSQEMVQTARVAFDDAEHTAVKMAATFVLIRQRGQRNGQFIRQIVFHPNDDLRRLGRFLRAAKNDKVMANLRIPVIMNGQSVRS
jgi:citrate synthase